MSARLIEIPRRQYPQTWWLLDVVDSELRLLGGEVVDLSPGAIELRHASRELRGFADQRANWIPAGGRSPLDALPARHSHALSFGPRLCYAVEYDATRALHGGRPFRHLRIRSHPRPLSPGTAVEVGLHVFGHRPVGFAYTAAGTAHGFVGFDWESLDASDVLRLAQREIAAEGDAAG